MLEAIVSALTLLAVIMAFTMPAVMVWCIWRRTFAGVLCFYGSFMLWVMAAEVTEQIVGLTMANPRYFLYTIGYVVGMFIESALTAWYFDRRDKQRSDQPATA